MNNKINDYLIYQGGIYGETISHRIPNKKKEFKNQRKKLKEKGEYMLPVKKISQNVDEGKKGGYKGLQMCISYLNTTEQDRLLELAKNIPAPVDLINETIAIQQYRIAKGLRDEERQGHLSEMTESAIQNLVSMINVKKVIEEGMEVNVNVSNSISELLDEIELEDKTIDIQSDLNERTDN